MWTARRSPRRSRAQKKFRDATRLRPDRCVGALAVVAPVCVAKVSLTVEQSPRARTRRHVVKSRREQGARVFSRASRGLVASGETASHLAVCNEPCSCFSRAGRHLEGCARLLEPCIPVPERMDLCYDDPDTRSSRAQQRPETFTSGSLQRCPVLFFLARRAALAEPATHPGDD
jgi:hypothetical protein